MDITQLSDQIAGLTTTVTTLAAAVIGITIAYATFRWARKMVMGG